MDSQANAERRHPTADEFREAIPAVMELFAVGRATLRLARDESVSTSEVAAKVAELDASIRSKADLLTEVNASYRDLLPEVESSSTIPNCAGWTADSMHEAIWFWVAHGVVQAGADRGKLASMPIPDDAVVIQPLRREMMKIRRILRDLEKSAATVTISAEQSGNGTVTKRCAKRGRKQDTDPTADARLRDEWEQSGCTSYAQFAAKKGNGLKATDVKLAIDRARKRQ